jgi:hypothetical protein
MASRNAIREFFHLLRASSLAENLGIFRSVPIELFQLGLDRLVVRRTNYHPTKQELLSGLSGFGSLEGYVHHCMERQKPRFFLGQEDVQGLRKIMGRVYEHEKKEVLEAGENFLAHRHDVLGSGETDLKSFSAARKTLDPHISYLPWHYDFKSGFRWDPRVFHSRQRLLSWGRQGVDIKVPWELSRCHHLILLGEAALLTGDENHSHEMIKQVRDWIENNPVGLGVNWNCPMEVAIRAANWIWAYYLCQWCDSPEVDALALEMIPSLIAHARFVRANIEKNEIPSNHYLSNLAGLIYVGIFLSEWAEAQEWLDYSTSEFIQMMEYMVHPDGMFFEASIPYHRLALELFLFPALLLKKNDIPLPDKFWKALYKMFDFLHYTLKPDGTCFQLGDNDNGRLHIHHPRAVNDHLYLLDIGAIMFEESKFKLSERMPAPETLWLFGAEGLEKYKQLSPSASPGSRAFRHSGVCVLGSNNSRMLFFSGPHGQRGIGSHSHNDKLSFALFHDGEEWLVDPGTYTYTPEPEWRLCFRSTAYHNTVVVDDQEQSPLEMRKPFWTGEDPGAQLVDWHVSSGKEWLLGEHRGYSRLSDPVIHRREVLFDSQTPFWLISDHLEAVATHTFRLHFHFGPLRLSADEEDHLSFLVSNGKTVLLLVPLDRDQLTAEKRSCWFSEFYGRKTEGSKAVYTKRTSQGARFTTLIVPATHREEAWLHSTRIVEELRNHESYNG